MRKIVNQGPISIEADDLDAENGNASHEYIMSWPEPDGEGGYFVTENVVRFQRGPVKEVGVNGVTNEALFAVVIDRLEKFQAGPFACAENASALWYLKGALRKLDERTAKRVARGVEGTKVK